MALLLNLETATTVCSVALAQDGKLLSLKEEKKGLKHSENITLFIEHVLKEAGKKISDLDAVAVSGGPGSYTGLRIGISTAKGLCFGLGIPLIAVSTLHSLTRSFIELNGEKQGVYYCPMIDARRMEVFCAVYDESLCELEKVSAKIMDADSFSDLLKEIKICFFGDGASKCKNILSHHPNAIFFDDVIPSAVSMILLSEDLFRRKEFEDVGLFEPFYLKEFFDGKNSGS